MHGCAAAAASWGYARHTLRTTIATMDATSHTATTKHPEMLRSDFGSSDEGICMSFPLGFFPLRLVSIADGTAKHVSCFGFVAHTHTQATNCVSVCRTRARHCGALCQSASVQLNTSTATLMPQSLAMLCAQTCVPAAALSSEIQTDSRPTDRQTHCHSEAPADLCE